MSKKILLTFAGNTDPTRGEHDGPIIHICRYYKPDNIYLILMSEYTGLGIKTSLGMGGVKIE